VFPSSTCDNEVQTWPDKIQTATLPLELRQAGFQIAAVKSIRLSSEECASVLYLWRDEHEIALDELPLISAQADVFAMILENELSRKMIQEWASMQERHHLRRELHDRISQDLFSLSIFGANGVRHASAGKTQALLDDLNSINILAQHMLSEMRLLLYELQPQSTNDPLHLEQTIQKRFAIVETHVNLQTNLTVSGCEGLPAQIAKTIYGVVIEALNNTVKYANAETVSVRIEADGAQVCVEIQDDGVGFDTQENKRHGMGLNNMRDRVAQANGTIQILSEPGSGTRITAVLPIAAVDSAVQSSIGEAVR
jgi:signal transduction histidine kinase